MNKITKITTALALTAGIMGAAVPAANAAEGAFPDPSQGTNSVQVANHRVKVSVREISSRDLILNGNDTNLAARYEIRAQRSDGRLLYSKNITVYKLVWFDVKFKENHSYKNNAALVRALDNATNESERRARDDFRDIFGSLGKFQSTNGTVSNPKNISDRN